MNTGSEPKISRQRSIRRSACSVGLDVLHDPAVRAGVVQFLRVLHHPLERPPGGAHALDRHDLVLQREDRLDPQRAAEPRLRLADAPAAAQVLERVEAEPDPQRPRASRARARRRRPCRRPRAPRRRPRAPAARSRRRRFRRRSPRRARRGRARRAGACAWRAASQVPEMPPARWIETTSCPASSSGSQTARKSPIEGCEVVGSSGSVRSRS